MASQGIFGFGGSGAGGSPGPSHGAGARNLWKRHVSSGRSGGSSQTGRSRTGQTGRRSGEHSRPQMSTSLCAMPPGVASMPYTPMPVGPGPVPHGFVPVYPVMVPSMHPGMHPIPHFFPMFPVNHQPNEGVPLHVTSAIPPHATSFFPPGLMPQRICHSPAGPHPGFPPASQHSSRQSQVTRSAASAVEEQSVGDQNRPKSSNPNHYIPTRRGRRLATKSMLRKMLLQDIKQELSRRGHDFEGVADFWNKDKWVDVALDIIYEGQYEETARQWKDQIETEEAKARNDLKSNAKGLQLLFFGSSLGPSTSRGLPALAARLTRQVLMFSVGEDTQRRFAESLLSPYRVSRIFIPSRNPVFYLGLPGLICTISTSRSGSSSIPAEAEGRSPLRIYAPPGIAEYVHTTLDISNTYVSIPVVIYEFAEGPVSAEELRPRLINPRCRLFRALLPPDDVASTLPRMTDEEEEEFLFGMCYSKQVLDNTAPKEPVEDRSVYRQFRPVETEWPATPASNAGPTWTVGIEPQWRVICTRGPQDAPEGRGGMSFILSEADKAGKLNIDECQARGLKSGPHLMRLKMGETLKNDAGEEIRPEDVVSPDVPGRSIVVAMDRPHAPMLSRFARDASVVIHASSVVRPAEAFVTEASREEDLAVCEEAGRLCEEVGARQLMLTNFRVPREYDADREAMYIEDLCTAASRVYSGPVEAAEDCKLHSVDAVVREDEA